MTEDKQAVAENADAQQAAGTEAVGAQAEISLDDALDNANWDIEPEKPQSQPSSQTVADQDALLRRLEEQDRKLQKMEARLADQDFNSEFNSAADRLSDGLDVDPDDFKNMLYGRVARDPRLTKAYEARDKNPAAWRQVEQALKNEFKSKFPARQENIDMDATRDREAVAAAVQGQTSTGSGRDQPSDADLAKMSDDEFNDWQRSQGVNPY